MLERAKVFELISTLPYSCVPHMRLWLLSSGTMLGLFLASFCDKYTVHHDRLMLVNQEDSTDIF